MLSSSIDHHSVETRISSKLNASKFVLVLSAVLSNINPHILSECGIVIRTRSKEYRCLEGGFNMPSFQCCFRGKVKL